MSSEPCQGWERKVYWLKFNQSIVILGGGGGGATRSRQILFDLTRDESLLLSFLGDNDRLLFFKSRLNGDYEDIQTQH